MILVTIILEIVVVVVVVDDDGDNGDGFSCGGGSDGCNGGCGDSGGSCGGGTGDMFISVYVTMFHVPHPLLRKATYICKKLSQLLLLPLLEIIAQPPL